MNASKKAIWGWMFFDWANQPFHTLIVTFIFAPYFAASVAATPAEGQAMWSWTLTAGSLLIAVLAPILGSIADASGPRKPWIAAFSVAYVVGVASLWWAAPGTDLLLPLLALFVLALIGAEFAAVFVNSMLPLLGAKQEIGRISGSGWAMGYWGGLLSLIVVLGLIAPMPGRETTLLGLAPIFGLDPATGEGARATGPLSALWYLVFMIPFFLWTPDAPRRAVAAGMVGRGLRELRATLASLPSRPSLFAYLASSMLYRDALNGLYFFGGIYASGVLGWGLFELGIFGVIGALFGAIGAWTGGLMDARKGPKPVILFTILALIVVSAVTLSTGRNEVLLIAVGSADAPSSLPTIVFYICGAVIGAAGGSLQAASRTMLVRQAEEGRMAEAFGIYALAGKATSFLAPFLIGVVTTLSENQRIGVTPVILLFAIGFALMLRVDPDGPDAADGQRRLQGEGAAAT